MAASANAGSENALAMAGPLSASKKEAKAKNALAKAAATSTPVNSKAHDARATAPPPSTPVTPAKKKGMALLRSSLNEKHFLALLWNRRHMCPTVFASLDIEYDSSKGLIFELGLATKPATAGSNIVARHIIVDESIPHRKRRIKSFPFGCSQHVGNQKDLASILDDHFSDLLARYNTVVFCGHGIMSDLETIQEVLGWTLPVTVPILDTQYIWYGLKETAPSSDGSSLGRLLRYFKIEHQSGHLHNAGSDAWYTIKLILCKAEEVTRDGVQLGPLTGDCDGCDGHQSCPWKQLYMRVKEAAQPLLSLFPSFDTLPHPMTGHSDSKKRILEEDDSNNPSSAPKRRKTASEDNETSIVGVKNE